MVLKRPFPGLIATLWGEKERYGTDYWSKIPGVYYTGDSAHIDEDGYVWFAGRADEIIKIADHRIGTVEVETAFLMHPCGRRVRRHRTARRAARRGHLGVRGAQARRRADAGAQGRAARDGAPRAGAGGGHRRDQLREHAAQDAQRQDHAPRAQGGHARRRPRRHHDDRGRGLASRTPATRGTR